MFNLIGTWQFTGSILQDTQGNILFDPLHTGQGLLIYTDTHMAAQLALPKVKNSTSLVQTETDYLAYYGKYELDIKELIITHHVIASNLSKLINQSVQRKIKIQDDDHISLKNIAPEQYAINIPIFRELFWQKLS